MFVKDRLNSYQLEGSYWKARTSCEQRQAAAIMAAPWPLVAGGFAAAAHDQPVGAVDH